MNGCAACKHTADADPGGTPVAALGKSFWCTLLAKAVDARDGSACAQWEAGG
jgi:hypothetical protein